MWKDSANPRGLTKEQFEDRIVASAKITSMGSFLSIWNEITTRPGQYMPNQMFNLRLFKDGFKPTWEDSARAGKWVVMVDKAKVMDAFFSVSMALVSGSYFVHDYAMTGAVVSSRSRAKDAVSIWSNVELASDDVETIKRQLQELLGSGVTVDFLQIDGRIAMNDTERLKLSNGGPVPRNGSGLAKSSRQKTARVRSRCCLPDHHFAPSPASRSVLSLLSRPYARGCVQRALFGQPPRARAKSDTHLTQPHVIATEAHQYSDFERISSSSEARESHEHAAARRISDFEELQELLPPHLCREEKDTSPLYKEYNHYRQYKEARRRSSGSNPIATDHDLTNERRSPASDATTPKAGTRQRRRRLERRRSSGEAEADTEDAGMLESAEPLCDVATNPQSEVQPLSHSNLACFSQPSVYVKVLGVFAMVAGAVLTMFAGWLHFAAPLLR
jgi:hypothetical protein